MEAALLLAQSVQDDDAADGEADDGGEGAGRHETAVEMKRVSEDRGDREEQSQNIEPEWGAHG